MLISKYSSIVLIIQSVPYAAAWVILFSALSFQQAIGTYESLGIVIIVAFNVLGLNVISINESPFAIAFFSSVSSVESTPINRIVNGLSIFLSFDDFSFLEISDFLILFDLWAIILVSSFIFWYASIEEKLAT